MSRRKYKSFMKEYNRDISNLEKAVAIRNKLESGEEISDDERDNYKKIEEKYKRSMQGLDFTSTASLQDNIINLKNEKTELREQYEIKELRKNDEKSSKLETIKEEDEDSDETIKPHTSSKDFKQDTSDITSAGEPMDISDSDG